MATFKFRMQTILRLRMNDRDQRRAELAEALEAERLLSERIGQLQREIEQVKQQMRKATEPGVLNVDQLLNSHRYELLLMAHLKTWEQQRSQLSAEVERRRMALVEADRQVKVVEKLRERRLTEFQQQQAKQETKELDELAIRGYRPVNLR